MNELASTELEESKTESITTHEKLEGLPLSLWGVCCHSLILLLLSFSISLSCSCSLSRVYLYSPPFLPPSLPSVRFVPLLPSQGGQAPKEKREKMQEGNLSLICFSLSHSLHCFVSFLPFPFDLFFVSRRSSWFSFFSFSRAQSLTLFCTLPSLLPVSLLDYYLVPSYYYRFVYCFSFLSHKEEDQIKSKKHFLSHTHTTKHTTHTHTHSTHTPHAHTPKQTNKHDIFYAQKQTKNA